MTMTCSNLRLVLLFCFWFVAQTTAADEAPPAVVAISYADLSAFAENNHHHNTTTKTCSTLFAALSQAFGPDGLGLIQISDLPDDYVQLRHQVLHLSRQLAQLPPNELQQLERPELHYTIGWSHGREQFRGSYDTRKGSFYMDPFGNTNVYPEASLPDLEPALESMTTFLARVGLWVAQLCDAYLEQEEEGGSQVVKSLKEGRHSKARLLYYFSQDEQQVPSTSATNTDQDALDDSWCGWHKDHGSLTALVPGLLFGDDDDATTDGSTTKVPPGLYIQTRQQQRIHVSLPPNSIGFQVGETLELQSHGKLQATPHAVVSAGFTGGRSSLALFLQPGPDEALPACTNVADASLHHRWRPTFGAFQQATTEAFG